MALFDKKEKKENVISEQVAKDQINAFLDYYDVQEEDFQGAQKPIYKTSVRKITRAICDGTVIIKEHADGYPEVEQKLKSGSILVYGEMGAPAKSDMKNVEENDHNGRIYSVIGSLTGLGRSAIEELKGRDMGIAESLGALFLSV